MSRGEKTRTSGPYVPNVVRYQLRYTPFYPPYPQTGREEVFYPPYPQTGGEGANLNKFRFAKITKFLS